MKRADRIHPPGLDPVDRVPNFKPPWRSMEGHLWMGWGQIQSEGQDGIAYACVYQQGLYVARKGGLRIRGATLPLKAFATGKFIVSLAQLPLDQMKWVMTPLPETADLDKVWEWLESPPARVSDFND